MTALAPGTYLKRRRIAAGKSIADVAAAIATAPRLGEIDRCQLIRAIEGDARGATIHTLAALRSVYPFSLDVLARLIVAADGQLAEAPRLCRVCARSECDPCLELNNGIITGACAWSTEDLCSACDDRGVASSPAAPAGEPA